MEALVSALARYGGVITAPRRTVAALRAGEGERDGLVLGLLYVVAVGTFALIESIAGIVAMRDLGAFVMLASTLGRLAIAPILVLVAAETILGKGRTHRRGLALVPLIAVAVAARELAGLGVDVPMYAPEIVGAVLGLALTWWIRPEIPRQQEARA